MAKTKINPAQLILLDQSEQIRLGLAPEPLDPEIQELPRNGQDTSTAQKEIPTAKRKGKRVARKRTSTNGSPNGEHKTKPGKQSNSSNGRRRTNTSGQRTKTGSDQQLAQARPSRTRTKPRTEPEQEWPGNKTQQTAPPAQTRTTPAANKTRSSTKRTKTKPAPTAKKKHAQTKTCPARLQNKPRSTPAAGKTDLSPNGQGLSPLTKMALFWSKIPRWNGGGLLHLIGSEAKTAEYSQLETPLPEQLTEYLKSRRIEQLYSHQVDAIDSIRSGQDTVIASSTSSGKTLCYQIPLLEYLINNPRATGLLLYPTKALAQDQLRSLREYGIPGIRAFTYDGDSTREERREIRRKANLILTNPDMLHTAILPNHNLWKKFLQQLSMVVVDEMHTMRGIFGTHVSLILRRLFRLCDHYRSQKHKWHPKGPEPTLVFTSATIANPGQLASLLSGRAKVEVIDQDTSPRGKQWLALWNPPYEDLDKQRRIPARTAATSLFVDAMIAQHPTIVFTMSRKDTELIYQSARRQLPTKLKKKIAPYRGGYRPEQRREIERKLFSHQLLGVVATNALELGVDVGSLDVVMIAGFPGTIASFRQQSGRAGRRNNDSLVALVASDNALDQYFMKHGDQLMSRPPEGAIINPHNPVILQQQLRCAANEMHLHLKYDQAYFGEELGDMVQQMLSEGELVRLDTPCGDDSQYGWNRHLGDHPSGAVNLRSAGGGTYILMERRKPLETNETSRVLRENHPEAVFLHHGTSYVVQDIDHQQKIVRVKRQTVDYYTVSGTDIDLNIRETLSTKKWGAVQMKLGNVRVITQVNGYKKINRKTRTVEDRVQLKNYPSTVLDTQAVWWEIPDEIIRTVDLPRPLRALHAAEHAAISMLPLIAASERWDVGGLSIYHHPDTKQPTFFIYEAYSGGAGISSLLFERGRELIKATLDAIDGCGCSEGCPSCIQSPKCGNYNEELSKNGAVKLLDLVLQDPKLPPALPEPKAKT